MAGEPPGQMRIGAVLRDARERAGLELRDVSERTKIRLRYLGALEDEHWDDLPSAAYAKGFLRTYAQLLGLDAEALVDEFRRQVEGGGGGAAYPLGEPVLERRRRPGERSGREVPRWLVGAGLIAAVLAALVAVGLLSADDENEPARDRERPAAAGDGRRNERGDGGAPQPRGTVSLRLRARKPVEVCLVGGGGEALIDRQVLAEGTEDEFRRRRFELRFPAGFEPGQVDVEIAGKSRRLPRVNGPAAYEIVAPKRVETVDPPAKEDCP
jgi:cytoskeleton protein RodZ